MALVVLKAIEKPHPDPIQDRMRYKLGDVVEVFDDDELYRLNGKNSKVCLPDFLIVKIPGTKRDNLHLMKSITVQEETPEGVQDRNVYRRQYKFDITKNITTERLQEISESKELAIDEFTADKVEEKLALIATLK